MYLEIKATQIRKMLLGSLLLAKDAWKDALLATQEGIRVLKTVEEAEEDFIPSREARQRPRGDQPARTRRRLAGYSFTAQGMIFNTDSGDPSAALAQNLSRRQLIIFQVIPFGIFEPGLGAGDHINDGFQDGKVLLLFIRDF